MYLYELSVNQRSNYGKSTISLSLRANSEKQLIDLINRRYKNTNMVLEDYKIMKITDITDMDNPKVTFTYSDDLDPKSTKKEHIKKIPMKEAFKIIEKEINEKKDIEELVYDLEDKKELKVDSFVNCLSNDLREKVGTLENIVDGVLNNKIQSVDDLHTYKIIYAESKSVRKNMRKDKDCPTIKASSYTSALSEATAMLKETHGKDFRAKYLKVVLV